MPGSLFKQISIMMKYDQLILYYFSGTGNARNAAIWIEKIAKEKGLTTYLINIDRFKTIDIPELSEKTLIGFCSPTHGFNMPQRHKDSQKTLTKNGNCNKLRNYLSLLYHIF